MEVLENCEVIGSQQPDMQFCNEEDNRERVKITQLEGVHSRRLTNMEKFKIMDEQGKKLAQLCCEVSTPVFFKRLETVESILKFWTEGRDSDLLKILKNGIQVTSENAETVISSATANVHGNNILVTTNEPEPIIMMEDNVVELKSKN